jgi:hypothetical protein
MPFSTYLPFSFIHINGRKISEKLIEVDSVWHSHFLNVTTTEVEDKLNASTH